MTACIRYECMRGAIDGGYRCTALLFFCARISRHLAGDFEMGSVDKHDRTKLHICKLETRGGSNSDYYYCYICVYVKKKKTYVCTMCNLIIRKARL